MVGIPKHLPVLLLGLSIGICLSSTGCTTSDTFMTGGNTSQTAQKVTYASDPPDYVKHARGKIRPASAQANDGTGQVYGSPEVHGKPMPNLGAPICPGPGCAPPGDPSDMGKVPCPGELRMTSHPPYTIAPPDILYIDALRLIPKPPYRIEPLEVLLINVSDTLPNQPIMGPYTVSPEGTLSLGFGYGSVRIGGMTLDQAQEAIRRHLGNILRNPQVSIALAQFRGMQQIRGEHLVRPDGTISLGTFGSVYVAGMTLGQAKCVIEKYLSNYLLDPQVSTDVFAYNSKVFYVIIDGGGYGQQVFRLPVTGNETVLDAISQVQGLAPVSSKRRIWLARPSPVHQGCNQVLPVDWNAITQAGSTPTNYQVFPGDRIYVDANPLICLDNRLAQILAPVERILGITFLGANTIQSVRAVGQGTGGTGVVIVP
jgi:polysaccharide export outer membrane protein